MKQFNLLPVRALIILFAFCMVACEDDDSEEPNANSLVGSWQWTVNERTNCGDPADEGKFALTDCSAKGCFFFRVQSRRNI